MATAELLWLDPGEKVGLLVGARLYGTQSVALMFGSVSHFRGTGRSGYTKDHPVFAARCIQMGQKDGTTHHYDWALSFLV